MMVGIQYACEYDSNYLLLSKYEDFLFLSIFLKKIKYIYVSITIIIYNMKQSLLLLVLCSIYSFADAQHNFVVQNGSAVSVYRNLADAYNGANSGDTLYLPGGAFTSPSPVDKSLVWLGVGHYPDSTLATSPTVISNTNLSFSGNCDSSFFSGIYFEGNVTFGNTSDDAVNVTIERCRFKGSLRLKQSAAIADIGFIISECVTEGGINGNYASNCLIEKTILSGSKKYFDKFENSYFDRIISTSPNTDNNGNCFAFISVNNSLISNSIFNQVYNRWNVSASTGNNFTNNIICRKQATVMPPAGNSAADNILTDLNIDLVIDSIQSITAFSYGDSYQLEQSAPGHSDATDGSSIGLYGGSEPYKEGGVPSNPHVSFININNKTENALLPVEINVGAQDR